METNPSSGRGSDQNGSSAEGSQQPGEEIFWSSSLQDLLRKGSDEYRAC